MKSCFMALAMLLLIARDSMSQSERKSRGFFNITQVSFIHVTEANLAVFNPVLGGYSRDLKTGDSRAFGLNSIVGYFIIPQKISLGASIGLEGYQNPDHNTAPLYADLRYYWVKRLDTPYVYFQVGTLMVLGNGYPKGNGGRVGVGYKWNVAEKTTLTADLSLAGKSFDLSDTSDMLIRGAALSIGIMFF